MYCEKRLVDLFENKDIARWLASLRNRVNNVRLQAYLIDAYCYSFGAKVSPNIFRDSVRSIFDTVIL